MNNSIKTTRTCGEALMHLLEDYGVTTVFGIPGEHTLELYRGIEGSNVNHITPRNEQGAGFMADGYGRVTGNPGVCTIITGPGVTNAATAIGQAYADSVPMLIISSANDSPSLGKGWGRLHETRDLCAITAPITAFSAMVHDPAEVPGLIARAFSIFHSARPRPVHIAIPIDVMEMPVKDDWRAQSLAPRPAPSVSSIKDACDLLETADRTVMLVGGGAQDAGDNIEKLAELLGIGVVASNAGKGVIPDSNPLSLSGGVISPAVQDYVAEADVVLAIGTEIAEADSFIYDMPVNGKVIRVDIDPDRFTDQFPAFVPVLGDAGIAADMMTTEMESRGYPNRKDRTVTELDAVREKQAAAYTPVEQQHIRALNILRRELPAETVIMGDIAQLVYTGTPAMPTDRARTWFYPAGFGTLGCALPGAIGAKIAKPDTPVVALVGDGGFMFTVQELATAVEEELTIPIIMWDNDAFAMIRDGMVKRNIPTIGVTPRNPDFLKLAEAFGCPGIRVNDGESFQVSIRDALDRKGPTLIIIRENDDWLI